VCVEVQEVQAQVQGRTQVCTPLSVARPQHLSVLLPTRAPPCHDTKQPLPRVADAGGDG